MFQKIVIAGLSLLFLQSAWGSEISAKGKELAAFLDARDVEHRWLSKHYVEWKSGKLDGRVEVEDGKAHTHCSAFVASTAMAMGIYILRPPDHSATLLANAQYDWLKEKGKEKGWSFIETANEAQMAANAGDLVVAAYQASDAKKAGHIVIVRPSEKSDDKIAEEGPQIIQAGMENFDSTSLKEGFRHHKGAFEKKQIVFFAHAIRDEELKHTGK